MVRGLVEGWVAVVVVSLVRRLCLLPFGIVAYAQCEMSARKKIFGHAQRAWHSPAQPSPAHTHTHTERRRHRSGPWEDD